MVASLVGLSAGCFDEPEQLAEGGSTTATSSNPAGSPSSSSSSPISGAGDPPVATSGWPIGGSGGIDDRVDQPGSTSGSPMVDGSSDDDSSGVADRGEPPRDLNAPYWLRVHDGYVYFGEHGSTGGSNGAIRRFSSADPSQVETIAVGMQSPRGFAFGEESVYFYEVRYQQPDALWRAPLAGPPTEAELLVDDLDAVQSDSYQPPYGLAVGNGLVFYLEDDHLLRRHADGRIDEVSLGGHFAQGLLSDDDFLYFTRQGVVYRMPTDFVMVPEPEPQPIGTLPDGHFDVVAAAHDDDNLYFTTNTYDNGGIVRMAKDGGSSGLLVADVDPLDDADDSPYGLDLAVDDDALYYITGSYSYRVWRVDIAQGAVPQLLAEADDPSGVAVDDGYVYWTEFGEGSIVRLPKE